MGTPPCPKEFEKLKCDLLLIKMQSCDDEQDILLSRMGFLVLQNSSRMEEYDLFSRKLSTNHFPVTIVAKKFISVRSHELALEHTSIKIKLLNYVTQEEQKAILGNLFHPIGSRLGHERDR